MLMTDHHSLINYFKQPTLNAKQAYWANFLSEFDFEIKHLKEKENRVGDALSRKVNCLYEISFSESRTTFFEQIQESSMQDSTYKHLWQQ